MKREASPATGCKKRAVGFAGLLLLAAAWIGDGLNAAPSQEHAIKAAFLYNLAQFVEWPAESFDSPNAPFVVGLLEPDPFDGFLEELVRGQTVQNRPIRVVNMRNWGEVQGCHMLFIPEGAGFPPQRLRRSPVLLVGETAAFARRGGMISLVRDGDRVRVEANRSALAVAGLRPGARLLGIARVVDNGTPRP